MDLTQIKKEYQELTDKLTDPELISRWKEFQEISKKRGSLEKIIKKAEELEDLKKKIEENKQILSSQEDAELSSLAQQELLTLEEQAKNMEREMEKLASKKDRDFPEALILEIRPGTGGEEAALFARNLLNMYTAYAKQQGFKQTLLDVQETDLGGLKSASIEIEGEDAFEKLQYEGGVHRVQRIPETEKSGRIHTSTASLAVLPKPKREALSLNPADIKTEFTRSSGAGGQNVNKRETAVRLIHIPTGIAVESQAARTQQRNREFAMALLEAKIAEAEAQKKEQELSKQRRGQIKWAKRSEKIRTYNFPQDRITDHRIEKSWHGIEKMMEGNLNPIIESLQEYQESSSS